MNPNFQITRNVKRVLPHILFWGFYVLFFGIIYGKYGNDYSWYLLESLCMMPFVMLATYIAIYIILPFYLNKRKLLLTVLSLVSILFFATLGERIFLKKLNSLDITFESLFGIPYLSLLLETNFIVGFALAIKMVKKLFEQKQEKHEMEKQNLKTELSVLKAQLHPHFLFNTMNNLYALSIEKSSKTSEGIVRISELLRSILYDCNETEILLGKEIKLIENYIDLEKMRYGKNQSFNFEISGSPKNRKIAPMILFTFVENCFKHCTAKNNEEPFIKMELDISKNKILFKTENSIAGKINKKEQNGNGGIGLNNVLKRLEIIYGRNHDLKIVEGHNTYKVALEITENDE